MSKDDQEYQISMDLFVKQQNILINELEFSISIEKEYIKIKQKTVKLLEETLVHEKKRLDFFNTIEK
jgi:hypothetical protein